jgi:hypothetical protein
MPRKPNQAAGTPPDPDIEAREKMPGATEGTSHVRR